jgi:hypothetical protein
MTVINIHHRQSALYCDGQGDEIMRFPFTHRRWARYSTQQQLTKGRQTAGLFVAYFAYRRKCITPTQRQVDTSYSGARDWLIHTAPSHNRVSCLVSQIIGQLQFCRTNLCDQSRLWVWQYPHQCPGNEAEAGGYSENISQLVPSMAHMLTCRLWDNWLIIGPGSQEPVGRRLECYNWIPPVERTNDEPIGAMISPNYAQSLRRNDWSKFGYEHLGAWTYHYTPTIIG